MKKKKGKGLIILLHGALGVGKTTTAGLCQTLHPASMVPIQLLT
jgi:tRNA A37 threonylcarbamoyladenosine biosynthesis protein TsaE